MSRIVPALVEKAFERAKPSQANEAIEAARLAEEARTGHPAFSYEVFVTQVIKSEYVALQIRGKAYVLDTQYEKAFETDVHKRVLRAFRKHDVKPPAMLHRVDSNLSAALKGA